jgi:D-alanyl-D-alanine carboxypeptidase
MIRRSPDDAAWHPWFFLSVAVLALAVVVSVAAIASACGSGSGGDASPAVPLSPETEVTATEEPTRTATATPTPTDEPSSTATATPTDTTEPDDGNGDGDGGSSGPDYVDNSPEVACSVGAPLGQNARVARDCVIGPLVSVEGYLLNADAAAAYEAMRDAAAADGITLFIVSAYRDFDTQYYLYQQEVAQHGPDQNTSAKPGHSEHQLGTTVDLNDLSQSFGSTPEGLWLQENAGRFGFRMSFPAGMEAQTGYAYEPWHWRWWG